MQSRSDDGGRTFAKATPVPGSDAAGNRGWENARRRSRRRASMRCGSIIASSPSRTARSPHRTTITRARSASRPPIRNLTASRWRSGRSSIVDVARRRGRAARAHRRRLLLLQDRRSPPAPTASLFAAWRHVLSRQHPRHRASRSSRDGGKTLRAAAPRQRGQVGARRVSRTMGRRWRWTRRNRVHIVVADADHGRNRRRTDDRAVLRDVGRRRRASRARRRIPTEGMPHHPQIADWRRRIADDGVGRGREREASCSDRRSTTVDAAAGGAPLVRTALADGGGLSGGGGGRRRDDRRVDVRRVGGTRQSRWRRVPCARN